MQLNLLKEIFNQSYIEYNEHMSKNEADYWNYYGFATRRLQIESLINAINEDFNFDKIITLETGASQNRRDGIFGFFLGLITAKTNGKMISFGMHGTAQCKYWNNPNGWQDVVNFVRENGYEARLLSSEGYEYMGNNFSINGLTFTPTSKIENTLKVIQESELFIGISSGLSWLAWAAGTETILISGFTDKHIEPINGIRRIINEDVCHGCWSTHMFDKGDWNWCPLHKGTERQFECTKTITSEQVIKEIKSALKLDD